MTAKALTVFTKILVPVDGSNTSNRALAEAVALARDCKARVMLVHVVDKLVFAPTVETARALAAIQKQLRSSGRDIVKKAAASARAQGVSAEPVISEITGGRVAEAIVREAARWRADLIVMGTHGRRGINRLMLGSDAEQVVRTSPVPVLVVRSAVRAR